MKSARIVEYLASDAVRWQEDKYVLQQQQVQSSAQFEVVGLFTAQLLLTFSPE